MTTLYTIMTDYGDGNVAGSDPSASFMDTVSDYMDLRTKGHACVVWEYDLSAGSAMAITHAVISTAKDIYTMQRREWPAWLLNKRETCLSCHHECCTCDDLHEQRIAEAV